METGPTARIEAHFGKMRDHRIGNAKRHKLLDIIAIAICVVICGSDSWSEIELFGKNKLEWLEKFLELPNGIASHNTFGRVFAMLDSDEFRLRFMEWVQAINELTQGQVVAVNGKQLIG